MSVNRRSLLQAGLVVAGAAGIGPLVAVEAPAQAKPVVNLQLGWLLSGNQIGEVCAKQMGSTRRRASSSSFQPGGPNIDGVAIVASGPASRSGQVSSSPSLMLAVSQDLPSAASPPARRSTPSPTSR